MSDTPPREPGRSGPSPGVVVGMLLGAALTLFVAQNARRTTVRWLVFEAEQPLWAVLLVTSAVTLVIAELLGGARRRRKKRRAADDA